VETMEPMTRQWPHGRARIVAAGMLGALGIVGQLITPALGMDNSGYGTQLSFARIGWLATCCLAAVIVRPDWRGLLAAWVGALVALVPAAPLSMSHSPTTAGSAFWIGTAYLGMAVWAGAALLLARRVTRVIVAVAPPAGVRRILVGLLGVLLVATITLLVPPPGPDTGPQPAPTAPPG